MSDPIKHECGIVLIRLLKPLEYYHAKYGTWRFGLNKLQLLMEKQRNRGQDGAGIACGKIDLAPGKDYLNRLRSIENEPLRDIFKKVADAFQKEEHKLPKLNEDPILAKENFPYAGEIYLGHLRYGTYGKNDIRNVHPVMRVNNWKTRTLLMAGNFNLTNVTELFDILIRLGQHPRDFSDTVTMLENVGHFLDEENENQFLKFKKLGYNNKEISDLIAEKIDIAGILSNSSKKWDGGYAIAGILGHGDSFVLRDPWGIRPAYYYHDDEIVVVTSERPAIQTAIDVNYYDIKELDPGKAIIIKANGEISNVQVRGPFERKACSFERIYFSRGTDREIYLERKNLGKFLTPSILNVIENDFENTVFSFIPNTAESAFLGMVKGLDDHLMIEMTKKIQELGPNASYDSIYKIVSERARVEKVAVKDVKMRTFISQDEGRDDLVGHVYDVTYGIVRNYVDNLVIIDDSIVRGTTLKKSILRILDRLKPKRIIVVSSSPQIRYPDCYGIDMAKLGDFIAFKAAIELLRETKRDHIINEVYNLSKEQEDWPKEDIQNYVKEIYKPFTDEQISDKIAKMLKTKEINAEVKIVYQTIEDLHKACPNNLGDWYFTGDYPTPGGNRVVNKAFINYIEKRDQRAY